MALGWSRRGERTEADKSFQNYVELIILDRELARGESFPKEYLKAFRSLWADGGVQQAVLRGNEFALHDNLK